MTPISFTAHPESVGESYGEHLRSAWGFGFTMLGASLACFAHGLLPFVCTSTGSTAIRRLHERMVTARMRHASAAATPGRVA